MMSVLTFLKFSVIAFLMETRFAFLKLGDTFPKQKLNISQSRLQKSAQKHPKMSSSMTKNETENILSAPTEYLLDILT